MGSAKDAWTELVEVQLKHPLPVPEPEGIKRLFKACRGKGLEDRRDRAIIRLLLYTGLRGKELARLTLDDIDWSDKPPLLRVKNERRRGYFIPFWGQAATDLRRYLELRGFQQDIGTRALWLHKSKPMTTSDLYRMVQDRGAKAGVYGINTRKLRGYSRLWAQERAIQAHHRFSPVEFFLGKKKPPSLDTP